MKRIILNATLAGLIASTPAFAHYGMIIPDDPMISQEDGRSVALTMSFSHPFEMDGMTLGDPVAFTVTHEGNTLDLSGDLTAATVMDDAGFTLNYPLERPGTYIFAMEPQPYWEPAEDAFITSRIASSTTLTQNTPVSRMLATLSLVSPRSALALVEANMTCGGT